MLTSTKKALFSLAIAATLIVGGAAVAADFDNFSMNRGASVSGNPTVGSDGKRYTDYSEYESGDLVNALDRDHPVATPPAAASVGSDGKNYTDYSEWESEDMVDAIDRDHPVATPQSADPAMGSDGKRYTDYKETQSDEMIDAIDRDHPVTTPF